MPRPIEYNLDAYYTNLYRNLIVPKNEDERLVLGRKFATNIRKLDSYEINRLRAKIEDIKLAILDAAEKGEKPPTIQDTQWLYELYYSKPEYKFIYREFDDWMILNGLEGFFRGDFENRSLRIQVNYSKVDIGKSADLPDTTELIEKVLKGPNHN